jgi:hypothetical protein
MPTINIDVDVDVDDVLEEISTSELVDELKRRLSKQKGISAVDRKAIVLLANQLQSGEELKIRSLEDHLKYEMLIGYMNQYSLVQLTNMLPS